MPYVRSRYYREEEKPAGYRRVEAGFGLLEKNTLFHQLDGYITAKPSHLNAKEVWPVLRKMEISTSTCGRTCRRNNGAM